MSVPEKNFCIDPISATLQKNIQVESLEPGRGVL